MHRVSHVLNSIRHQPQVHWTSVITLFNGHFSISILGSWRSPFDPYFFLVKLSKLQVDGVGFRIFPSINAGLRRAGLAVQHAPTPGWMTMGRGLG